MNVPESRVSALPTVTYSTDFPVSWSGTDNAEGTSGSGIATYDVFVSDDGAPYICWQDDTPDTSAIFGGQLGHTYAFYSICSDNVGHRELAPLVADTQTLVSTNHAPIANDDLAGTDENTVGVIDVLSNDTDADADPLSAVPVDEPSYGVLSENSDGTLSYTPLHNFNREDSFRYRANDGAADSQTATVQITVNTAFPWHNGISPLNVNDDKYFDGTKYVDYIAPLDALLVINVLNSEHEVDLPTDRPRPLTPPFLDVSRDGQLTPFDALLVINFLNEGSGNGEGESPKANVGSATTWWQSVDATAQEPAGAHLSAEKHSRDWRAEDPRQSASILQSLDLLFAKLDDAHRTRTGEAAAARRDTPAGDLEEFLDGMLSGGADEEELFATAVH
jgi:hypothetical protein